MSAASRRGVLCTPLRVERAALRGAAGTMRLVRTGMGPRCAAHAAATLSPADPVLVAGLAAAQSPHIRPGDVVVASEIRASARRSELPGSVEIPSAVFLAGALRRLGLRVHVGPICSVPRIAWGPVADGSLAVDMESAQLASPGRPFAVVRAIVDTPDQPLWHIGTPRRGIAALRTLRACRPALEWWAAATGPREVLLVAPRSFYTGASPTNRQQAVRAIARQMDLMLVAGSPNSSNSARLVEVTERAGVPAYLVDDVSEIDLRWLAGRPRLGITADASAPPHLVNEIGHCLSGLGPLSTDESHLIGEDVAFALPKEVS
jgi:4-hydroxy-3-methylbut-2-en-1-yl diphosphate reductase